MAGRAGERQREVKSDEVCSNIGGALANIYTQEHMDLIMEHTRENQMYGLESVTLRTGMTINTATLTLLFRDGSTHDSKILTWMPGIGASGPAINDNVFLRVTEDESDTDQFLFNQPDDEQAYVLCEIGKSPTGGTKFVVF